MVNPKLEYIEDIVRSNFSSDFQECIKLTPNENNLIIIEVKYESNSLPASMCTHMIHERIVDGLFPYGMRVNEDYKVKTDITWKPTKKIRL